MCASQTEGCILRLRRAYRLVFFQFIFVNLNVFSLRMIRQNKQCQHWVRILWFQLEPQPCFLCFLHHYYYKVNKLENSNLYILYLLIQLFQPNKYNIYTLYLFLSSILCWTLLLHFPQTNIALFWCSFRLFVRLNIFPFTTDDAR